MYLPYLKKIGTQEQALERRENSQASAVKAQRK
jgi:hypothetical protein